MVDKLPLLLFFAVVFLAAGVGIWAFERKAKRDNPDEFPSRGRHPRWLRIMAAYVIGHGLYGGPPAERDVGPRFGIGEAAKTKAPPRSAMKSTRVVIRAGGKPCRR